MKKERLDVMLVTRGLEESREKAKRTIMAGLVYVNGAKEDKAEAVSRRMSQSSFGDRSFPM